MPRLLGGKGGFGSLLRSTRSRGERVTTDDAMRDLSGRRMRHVNNEKQLQEWYAKAGERKAEEDAKKLQQRADAQAKRTIAMAEASDRASDANKRAIEISESVRQSVAAVTKEKGTADALQKKESGQPPPTKRLHSAFDVVDEFISDDSDDN